ATQRIRLGALVTPLARRRPWQVARATVGLDRLSGGRLVFGAGSGSGRASEWEDLGEPADARTRAARLDEGLQVLAGLWSAAPFSFAGQHYRVHQACFAPPPLQSPRIPIWIAGHWPHPRPFTRAARWDGVFPEFPNGGDELDQLRAVCTAVRAQRQAETPFDVVYASAPQSSARDLADCAAAGATWWLARLDPPLLGCGWDASWPLDAVRTYIARGPVGAPPAGV
ncbi:MAG: LLM class flavin-dependent oxidoreductase, partial [Candidatus Binatia bacterium]